MPRLLLVDDNQSIHKIAETLLTATDIELTCAASGAEALEQIAAGGSFDAALLDTTMQGMDGWELLARLRGDPATALLPIAMMAGVLDAVDPETVRKAPIQGFLKKPVELRDLAARVHALAATVVEPPPPPEPEPEPEPEPAPESNFATMPFLRLADHPLPDADLLLLEPADILVEPAPEARNDTLELEELDLDLLKGIALAEAEAGDPSPAPEPTDIPTREDLSLIPDFAPEDAYQSGALNLDDEPSRVVTDELPDLGADLEPIAAPPAEAAPPPHDYWSDQSESMLGLGDEPADFGMDSFLEQEPSSGPTPAFLPDMADALPATPVRELPEALPPMPWSEPESEAAEFEAPAGEEPATPEEPKDFVPPWAITQSLPAQAEEAQAPAAEAVPAPEPAAPEAPGAQAPAPQAPADLLAALLADPVLMDQLAKAVVARAGDQVLREIAWDVMPELADRLRRN